MATPALSPETSGQFPKGMMGTEKHEFQKPILLTLPDGTTQSVYSKKEAIKAIQEYRESVN